MNLHEEIAACDNRIAELKTERDTALESLHGMKEERDRFERMFVAACEDLAMINEKLDLDPDDGGAEPIIAAIEELQGAQSAPAVKYGQDNPPRLRKPGESVGEYRAAMGWTNAPQDEDRTAFEKLARAKGYNLTKTPEGEYAFPAASGAWWGYQAATRSES